VNVKKNMEAISLPRCQLESILSS